MVLKNTGTQTTWAGTLQVITLFSEDLEQTKRFYIDIFALPKVFEDKNSVVFKMHNLLINFLLTKVADELVFPAKVGGRASGARMVLTIHVDDVDATCTELKALGLDLLLEPLDRPWGIRTANLADPDGYIWEIAAPIDSPENS